MSKNFDSIKVAIENKDQVEFDYDGYHRICCPHVLGYKDSKEQMLVFQFAGESKQGLPSGGEWRCFELSNVQNLDVHDGQWHTKPAKGNQSCVDNIAIKVKLN